MRFRVLGGVQARIGERSVELNRRRERCLLGLLLLEPGRPIGVERLIELLWDEPPPHAKRTVHSHIARVRVALAAAGLDGDVLTTEPGGYVLHVPEESVDAHRFRRLAREGQSTADPGERARRLRAALDLWTGPVLGDDGDSGLRDRVGAELDAIRSGAVEQWLAALVEAGRHEDALPHLASAAVEHPARERFTELLMTSLYRTGRKADALSAYERTRAHLAEHLGIDPTPALQRVHQLVLRDELATPAAAAPAHRSLPHDVPDFVGRQEDLAWLDDRAGDGASTAIIAGAAGIGKTALALRWAHRAAARFPDGQLYVNLRGYDASPPLSPLDALVHLLRVLGVPRDQLPTELDEASARFRSLLSARRMLLVLDNARTADQVRPLLPGDPGCQALVTSRDRLSGLVAHDSARRLTLRRLSDAHGLALLRGVLGEARLSAEPDAAARIVQLCGGLPLALRLAAAKLLDRPAMRLSDYADELGGGRRLASLSVPGDEGRAVRAVLEHSFDALRPTARRVFELLGLIPGTDFTAELVAAMTGADEVDTLDSLAAMHLIEQSAATGRYHLHDLVRDFAREKPTGKADGTALRRLLEYLRDMAGYANSFIIGGPAPEHELSPRLGSAAEAMAWFEAERANLTGAVPMAVAAGLPELACQIAGPMGQFFHHSGHIGDWISTFETAFAAIEDAGETTAKYFVLNSLGNAYNRAGRPAQAIDALRRAIAGREALGERVAAASSRHNLANLHVSLGEYDEALRLEEEALAIARAAGAKEVQTLILSGGISNVYQKVGRWHEALACLHESLAIVREQGSVFRTTLTLSNLGWIHLRLGETGEARRYFTEGIELARQVGDRYTEQILLCGLADVHRELGEFDRAIELRTAAHETIRRELRDYEADSLNGLGELYRVAGMPELARATFEEAREVAAERGERHELGRALAGLGMLDGSPRLLREALSLLELIAPVDAERVRLQLEQHGARADVGAGDEHVGAEPSGLDGRAAGA